MRNHAIVHINGRRFDIAAEKARMMLADFLRQEIGLTGTKVVCAEGDCGACTVLRSDSVLRGVKKPEYLSVNSCIMTVAQLDGSSLVTIDAIGESEPTPVQSSMMSCHGSQCGFCTPGFVMALTGLVEKRIASKDMKGISAKEAKNATTGNLCRCTGYQPIIEAAVEVDLSQCESVATKFHSSTQARAIAEAVREPLLLETDSYSFFAPTSLKEAAKYLKRHPEARLLGAATDLGVVHNKWKRRLDRVLSLHLVRDLYGIEFGKAGRVRVGARATLSELREALKGKAPEFSRFLDLFASPQIKNVATLIGNVANASPIADTPPFLLVSEAVVEVFGPKGSREIAIEEFFLDYRKTALKPSEFITAISFSTQKPTETLVVRKVSERKDLDISSVNAAFKIAWSDAAKTKVKSAKIAFGGIAATAVRLKKTENFLAGKSLGAETIREAVDSLQAEIAPIGDVRGSSAFRRILAENLLRSFLSEEAR
ncbi:MAG: FAD binding domain-containing protein [Bdellovibrionota bacterium]